MTPEFDYEFSPVDALQTEDRRSSERSVPQVDPTFLWISVDKRIRARLVDESEGGVGIVVPVAFEVGFRVRVDHRHGRRMAKVVHVSQTEDGCYRLGLAWID